MDRELGIDDPELAARRRRTRDATQRRWLAIVGTAAVAALVVLTTGVRAICRTVWRR